MSESHSNLTKLLIQDSSSASPRKDRRGVDLISDALSFGRLWYGEPNAIGYAKFYSRSYDAVIRVYDDACKLIERHEHAGDFKELKVVFRLARRNGCRYKMPLTMPENLDDLREEVWDAMLTAEYNSRYWEHLFKRYYRRQKVAEIFLAVTSSSSVAAWSIWRNIDLVWQCLAALSTLVAVTLPILNYKKHIADLSEILSQWVQIDAEYELLWFDIEHGTPTRDRVIDQYKKLKRREIEVDKITSTIRDDEKLLELCRQQVINSKTKTTEEYVQKEESRQEEAQHTVA